MKKDIVKSNALIEAIYSPGNIYQMRLLMAALMQIKSKEKLDSKQRYFVTANALADMTGSEAKNNYVELKQAANDLMDTIITVHETPEGKPLGNYRKINLVSSCDYFDGEGKVGLRFTDEITPYVSDLKTRFTKYQAKYVMPMRSSYGIRLYELCLQWLGDEREFSVNEFRRMFELETKYKQIEALKRRVIQPALDDINKWSDIRVDFGQRKSGRNVTHFQFMITRKKATKKTTFNDYVKANARAGESWETAKKRLRKSFKEST